jgi:hypothetical protein
MKAVQKGKSERYRTAREMADDLERYRQGLPTGAHDQVKRLRKRAKKGPGKGVLVAAGVVGGAVLVAALLGGAYLLWQRLEAGRGRTVSPGPTGGTAGPVADATGGRTVTPGPTGGGGGPVAGPKGGGTVTPTPTPTTGDPVEEARRSVESRYLALAAALRAESFADALKYVSPIARQEGRRNVLQRLRDAARNLRMATLGADDIEVLDVTLSDDRTQARVKARIRDAGARGGWRPVGARWGLVNGVWYDSTGRFKYP